MTRSSHIALMASLPLPAADAAGAAPEWIHLLPAPADGLIRTADARGPYKMGDAAQVIAASFARTDRIEVDLNHATYLAAPRGERSDAYGWIVEMQAREDGVWGRVEWTDEGQRLVAGKAYRGISPVIVHDAAKTVLAIANASLVNRPNLRGLTALNQEGAMPLKDKLAEKLGLGADASEDDVFAAAAAKLDAKGATATALQSQLSEIGETFGLDAGAAAADIVTAAKAAKATADGGSQSVVALQAEVDGLKAQIDGFGKDKARAAAEAFIDGAIREGRSGVPAAKRDEYVALHMENPVLVERLVGDMPKVAAGRVIATTPPAAGGEIALNAEQLDAARLLGIPAADYAATLKAERAAEETRR